MIKGIIFDLDGVIVCTDKYHYLSWKKVADDEGIYFDEVINNRLRGISRMASLEIILERSKKQYTYEEKTALAEKKNGLYKSLLSNLTENDRLDGVTETLDKLREKGYLLAIGSSSRNTPYILEKIGLNGFFDAVSDGNNISRSKPDPEVFEKAGKFLELSPFECVVVEDAVAGVEAGRLAGMTTVAVGDASKAKVADYNLQNITELLSVLEKLS